MIYWRRLPKFEYLAPRSVEKACSLLQEYKGKTRVLAGGTITLARMKERRGVRQYLIGLKNVPNLDYITYDEAGGLRIGTLTSHQSVADSPIVKERFEALAIACGGLGSPQFRNMGTIGGNLCSRFPSAEAVSPLVALAARIKIATTDGVRVVAIEDLFKELGDTGLLTEVQVPTPSPNSGGAYLKYTIREAIDFATVAVATVITSANGICQDIRIALGGVALTSIRASQAEEVIRGKSITDKVVAEAAQVASQGAQVASDIYFSAEYKKELIKILTQRAVKQAWEKAK